MAEASKEKGDAKDETTPAAPVTDRVLDYLNTGLGVMTEADGNKRGSVEYSYPVTYWNYIHPEELKSLQTGREGKGLHHHDEHLFIVVHQAFEVWFKQILWELDWVRDALLCINALPTGSTEVMIKRSKEVNIIKDKEANLSLSQALRIIAHRVKRADKIMRIATNGFLAMETMEPVDFLEFREVLSPASGFQSLQMREIEILIGLEDKVRFKCAGHDYRAAFTCPRDDFSPVLDARLAETNLRTALYTWLAQLEIPEKKEFMACFFEKKQAQFEKKLSQLAVKTKIFRNREDLLSLIDGSHLETIYNDNKKGFETDPAKALRVALAHLDIGVQPPTVTSLDFGSFCKLVAKLKSKQLDLLRRRIKNIAASDADTRAQLTTLKQFFRSTEPIKGSNGTKLNLLGDARTSALFLMTYRWNNKYLNQCEVVEAFVKLEQGVTIWRQRHSRMVEMMIGRRIGTGGSSGVDYLDRTASYRVFQDLWYIRSLCVAYTSYPEELRS